MFYTEEEGAEIAKSYGEILSRVDVRTIQLTQFVRTLRTQGAKEFWLHGVCRRQSILHRALSNIFALMPLDREEKLDDNERFDLSINIHAFLINLVGTFDNAAIAVAFELDIVGDRKDDKVPVGAITVSDQKARKPFGSEFRAKVTTDSFLKWQANYAKGYRDALAHRIPPYVPPAGLTAEERERYDEIEVEIAALKSAEVIDRFHTLVEEQSSLGSIVMAFGHSRYDGSASMLLHPQLIADIRTADEFIDNVREFLS